MKSIVPLNDPQDALDIFKQELMPAVQDVRGELVEVDLGDYLHAIARHETMLSRVRWVQETLTNPESVYRHPHVPAREVYVNTVFEDETDDIGALHLVIVERRLRTLKFWTSFVPDYPDEYLEMVEEGDLLWQPPNP